MWVLFFHIEFHAGLHSQAGSQPPPPTCRHRSPLGAVQPARATSPRPLLRGGVPTRRTCPGPGRPHVRTRTHARTYSVRGTWVRPRGGEAEGEDRTPPVTTLEGTGLPRPRRHGGRGKGGGGRGPTDTHRLPKTKRPVMLPPLPEGPLRHQSREPVFLRLYLSIPGPRRLPHAPIRRRREEGQAEKCSETGG